MIEFTWTINSFEKNTETGGIVRASWSVDATDGDYISGMAGVISFEPDPSNEAFIDFDSLTEDIVWGWIFLQEGQDSTENVGLVDRSGIEGILTGRIEEQRVIPVTTLVTNPF